MIILFLRSLVIYLKRMKWKQNYNSWEFFGSLKILVKTIHEKMIIGKTNFGKNVSPKKKFEKKLSEKIINNDFRENILLE